MEVNLLSFVIPLFNEQGNIDISIKKIITTFDKLSFFNCYEIILVNDGSRDNSLLECKNIASKNKSIKIVSFMRNFGHEYATYAGIKHASGQAVILMDADGQDPVELIIDFEKEYKNGHDIVYGQRTKRLNESFFKKFTSKLFYPTFKYLTNVDIPSNVGDFCLISRRVVDIIKTMPEKTIFIRGLIYWTGLPKKGIPFVRLPRMSGQSKYNYSKLTIFALENIISFSTKPIYFMIFFSLLLMLACSCGMVAALIMWLFGQVHTIGWTSLMITILFLFSATLFFLGILGLYIGKIFNEIKGRPVFLVDELINFD